MISSPMRRVSTFFAALTGLAAAWMVPSAVHAGQENQRICYDGVDYSHRRLDSDQRENLCEAHSGKVLLVVNTASRCAFTDQYEGLEKLYAQYRDQGLVVIGFPSNDFASQEPGNEKSIKNFCRLTYGVKFPMYAKTVVKGEQADPLYKALAQASGSPPRWNFYKYLIDREGRLVESYSSFTKPQSSALTEAIEKLL
jgi:glutathione peroxidase